MWIVSGGICHAGSHQSAKVQLGGASPFRDGAVPRPDPADASVSRHDSLGDPGKIISETARDLARDGSVFPASPLSVEMDSSASCAASPPTCPPSPRVGEKPAARRIRTDLPEDVEALGLGTSARDGEDDEVPDLYAAQSVTS